VGSMRHRGPLGSDPGKETVRVGLVHEIRPGTSAVLGRRRENGPRPFLDF
jgi:hypothetical protein